MECAAAPENSLPRPARSASNQEVRQDTGDPCVKETLRQASSQRMEQFISGVLGL